MKIPQALEERLLDFAVSIITVVETLPNSEAGNHLASQLIRSGTSPAPNYGEAQSATDSQINRTLGLGNLRSSCLIEVISTVLLPMVLGHLARCDQGR